MKRKTAMTLGVVLFWGLGLEAVAAQQEAPRQVHASEVEQVGRQIVFESERDGQTEIYLMDADGCNQRRLTHTVGDDGRSTLPHWSPDRRKIAFSTGPDHRMEIYIMDRDGSNVRRVREAEGIQSEAWGPQWSPNGRNLVYVSNRGTPAHSQRGQRQVQ
jgi:Tol biopolymer transport system component